MDLIDQQPMREGWGRIWQGGEFADMDNIPRPLAIVSMIGAVASGFHICIDKFMVDDDTTTFQDNELFAMVESTIALLRNGFNVYLHCFEGKYRSTYLDVAIHMAVLRYSFDQALGYVKRSHPIATMRKGTEAQLRGLEERLKGLVV